MAKAGRSLFELATLNVCRFRVLHLIFDVSSDISS